VAALSSFAASEAVCCQGAGVIIRIEGRAQDVHITRTEAGESLSVARPRVLEVMCPGDVVSTSGLTYVVLSIDGAGTVKVDRGIAYSVPSRGGKPSLAGNAYRSIDDQVMPDMKRLPWNVRIRGLGEDFGFALPALSTGGERLTARRRTLFIRLVGGIAPYTVQIRGPDDSILASQTSNSHELTLPNASMKPGSYRLVASDATSRTLTAQVTVVEQAPPTGAVFSGLADPEIRSAAVASTLARDAPGTWSLEAEQLIASSPANGLDRDRVYELIERYGAE
jgi:hypothetical protein